MSDVSDLKELLIGRISRDPKEGRARLSRVDFEETLGDDCNMADVIRVEHKLARFRAASTGALGEVGIEMLIADPEREYIDTEAEYGTQ